MSPLFRTPRVRPPLGVLAILLAVASLASPAAAQLQTQQVAGVVRILETGEPAAGVTVRVQGGEASTVTDAGGRFHLRDVPSGTWTLEVISEAYGARTYVMEVEYGGFAEVEIHLESGAGTSPGATGGAPPSRVAALGHTVGPDELARAVPGVRTVGELIQRTVPAFRARSVSAVAGTDFCLEFRNRGASTLRDPGSPDPGSVYCNHPAVFLDGIRLGDPTSLYRRTTVDEVRRVQAIPPAEATGAFGVGSDGVILVETRYAAAVALPSAGRGPLRARRSSFDWSQDPSGHSFARTFLGAFLGNAAGLAAGVAVGRQCVFVEDRTQDIEFSCGNAGVAGAGVAAVALPALGSALGANLMGRTERSAGRFVPSVVGGAMGAVPGYIFALATVGEGVGTMNAVGKGFLVLAPPLLTTLADRLFRSLR